MSTSTPPQPVGGQPAVPAGRLPDGPFADRYVVAGELGRGGMAVVYRAEERKHGRAVAIKVLHPELAASVGAERFLREIRIAARLSHPHVVPLIDSGEAAGLLYSVSAYMPGGSLRDRLAREGRLPVADALRIAREVGAGLDFAHRAGVVHRDVKPENILFADDLALLADFGIAAVCEAGHPHPGAAHRHEPMTGAGVVLGTPEYMSPEQASGERDLDARSDVYSLACVVYEMLAGEPPFRGPNARATMARHVTEAPRPLRALRPDVPAGVEQAVARALAKDPTHRFPTVAAFVAAFVAALGEAEAPRPRAAGSLTRSVAVLPFVNASPEPENEYLSDGITDELIDALAKVEGLRVASRTSVFALKGKPQDVRAIGALLGVAVVLEGSVRKAGDRLRITAQLTSTDDGRLLWSQRFDRTLRDAFAIQDEIARTIVTTLRATSFADLAPTHPHASPHAHPRNAAAYAHYLRGRFELAKRTHEGVLAGIGHFEQAIAADPEYAPAYTGLADAYALQVDYRGIPVAEGLDRARSYARRALALDESLGAAHASLAWVLFIYDWDWAAAEGEFRRAVELDPRYAPAHQWYAFLLSARGRHDEALVEAHTAVELDPGSASARRSLGWQYLYARRYDRARDHLARAIEVNPTAEETYRVLGLVLALDGQHGAAERVLREACGMEGAGTYTVATLGHALARAGRRADAAAVLARLEERARQAYVSPVAFAMVHLGAGDAGRALPWVERAHAERRGWLAYLRVNPVFDPARGDPRFAALVERMRL